MKGRIIKKGTFPKRGSTLKDLALSANNKKTKEPFSGIRKPFGDM